MEDKVHPGIADTNPYEASFRIIVEDCESAKADGLAGGFALFTRPNETHETLESRYRISYSRRTKKHPAEGRNYAKSLLNPIWFYFHHERLSMIGEHAQKWASRRDLPIDTVFISPVDYAGIWGTSPLAFERLMEISENAGRILCGELTFKLPFASPHSSAGKSRSAHDVIVLWWHFVAALFQDQFERSDYSCKYFSPPQRRIAAVT